MKTVWVSGCAALVLCALSGCLSVKTENEIKPVEIKPIHITVDINLKVDRALDDFFSDMDEVKSHDTKAK